jgi:hypothetical protein
MEWLSLEGIGHQQKILKILLVEAKIAPYLWFFGRFVSSTRAAVCSLAVP